MDSPSPTDLAWAAGIIEGEGCISINKTRSGDGYRWKLRLRVVNANPHMVLKMQELFGGRVRTRKIKRKGCAKNFVWSASSGIASKVLNMVKPWLYTKSDYLPVVDRFLSTFSTGRARVTDGEVIERKRSRLLLDIIRKKYFKSI